MIDIINDGFCYWSVKAFIELRTHCIVLGHRGMDVVADLTGKVHILDWVFSMISQHVLAKLLARMRLI